MTNTFSPFAYYSPTVELLNITVGLLLNALLLLLIRSCSSKQLGNYKYLLATFATCEAFLCLLHGLLNPNITRLYYASFTVPFALMNIHFLYRYWSVARPTSIVLFSKPSFVVLIILYPLAPFVICFILTEVLALDGAHPSIIKVKALFLANRSMPVNDGWIGMDWLDVERYSRNLLVLSVTMAIIFGSFWSVTTLGSLTYRDILRTTTMSIKHREIQYTLLAAVCAQTFVPVFCVYIPYFLIIICPFMSLPGFGLVDHFSLLVSVFPGWDAAIIIMMIRDYRVGLARRLGLKREQKIVMMNTLFTSAVRTSMHP